MILLAKNHEYDDDEHDRDHSHGNDHRDGNPIITIIITAMSTCTGLSNLLSSPLKGAFGRSNGRLPAFIIVSIQVIIVYYSGSIALLADTIRSFGDALIAIPFLFALMLVWCPRRDRGLSPWSGS